MDYDEYVRIIAEFISHHPIDVPLTKIPNPDFPLRLFLKTFERVKIENGVLEVRIIDDRIMHVHKSIFLKVIGIT